MAVYLTLNIIVMSLKCILDSISLSLYNTFLALSWSSRESCIFGVIFFFVRFDFVAHTMLRKNQRDGLSEKCGLWSPNHAAALPKGSCILF